MTAKEIRKLHGEYVDEMTLDKANGEDDAGYVHHAQLHMLAEIAAQLADLNASLGEINSALWRRAPANPEFVGEFGQGSDYR